MAASDRFRTQHHELLKIVQEIEGGLRHLGAANAKQFRGKLNTLAGKIAIHLAMEDDSLYPRLMIHSNVGLRDVAAKFNIEMANIKQAFQQYNKRWSEIKIERDFAEFATDTESILTSLKKRITRENDELYSLYDRLSSESPS